MSAPKFTPGPWFVGISSDAYAEGECDTWIAVGPADYDAVALVVNENIKTDGEVGINARLIAAAPDLLDALEACAGFADCNGMVNGVNVSAAIARARGGAA